MINRIGRNFFVLLLGQIIGRGLTFLTIIYLTRSLLEEGFGIIVFATSVLSYAELMVGFGFDALGPREVARGKMPIQRLVGQVIIIRLLLLVPAFLGLFAFTWLAKLEHTTSLVIWLYGISLLAAALDLKWVFLGDERMRVPATAEVVCLALVAVGVLVLVRESGDVVIVPLIFLAARVLTVAGLGVAFWRFYGRVQLTFRLAEFRPLVSAALPLAGAQTVSTTLSHFDLVLVGLLLTVEAAGQYGVAFRVAWMPILITQAYFISIRPTVSRAFITGFEPLMPFLQRSIRLVAAFSIGITVGGIFLAKPIVIFLFTDAYLAAVQPLQILLAAYLLHTLNGHYRSLLISFNHQGVEFRIMALAATLNVVLSLLLVRPLGIVGAAFATLAARLVLLTLGYFAVQKLIRPVPLGRFLPIPLLCAILMGASLLATAPWHVITRTVVGGMVYFILLILFGFVSIPEAKAALRGILPANR